MKVCPEGGQARPCRALAIRGEAAAVMLPFVGCGELQAAAGAALGCGGSVGGVGMCRLFPGTIRKTFTSCL